MRWVMTRVLPVPAPASSSIGPSTCSTASRCCGFRPARKSMNSGGGSDFRIASGRVLEMAGSTLEFMASEAIVVLVKSCLLVLSALFPIVNPLGTSPIFLSLTSGYSSESRAILSRKVALNSFWLLTGSMLVGTHILAFFGISIPIVQIGGGLVVISAGWSLLQGDSERTEIPTKKNITHRDI